MWWRKISLSPNNKSTHLPTLKTAICDRTQLTRKSTLPINFMIKGRLIKSARRANSCSLTCHICRVLHFLGMLKVYKSKSLNSTTNYCFLSIPPISKRTFRKQPCQLSQSKKNGRTKHISQTAKESWALVTKNQLLLSTPTTKKAFCSQPTSVRNPTPTKLTTHQAWLTKNNSPRFTTMEATDKRATPTTTTTTANPASNWCEN